MKRFLAALLLALEAMTNICAAVPEMFIYRNDNAFHRVVLDSGLSLSHKVDAGDLMLDIDFPGADTGLRIPVDAIDSCIVRTSDIPTLHLSLVDYPDATSLWEKELYLNAVLDIDGHGYTDDSDALALTVKGRGNSTWGMPKKPMRLKFAKKTSICGFKKAKSYVLLANYIDRTLCKNAITFWLANRIGLQYTNTFVPCNVVLNNTSLGAYLLTGKVGINSASVDIDEETGMLFELGVEFDEKYKFHSARYSLPVMVKDPDFDDLYQADPEGLTPEQRLALWRQDFNAAEELLSAGRGFEAFDKDSFVKYMFIYNFTRNNEIGWPKSFYIYKRQTGPDTPYCFGPVWDFDYSYDYMVPADNESGYKFNSPSEALSANELLYRLTLTPGFMDAYRELFDDFEKNIYPGLLDFLDSYAALVEPSAKLDGLIWPFSGKLYDWVYRDSAFDAQNHISDLRLWIESRVAYMKKRIAAGKI